MIKINSQKGFLKKLSRKTNKPFKDIPLDRPATYKQRAVAWQFENVQMNFPINRKALL